MEQVFQAAADLDPVHRDAYLADACSGDEELRREVFSLLEAHEAAELFLERPALDGSLRGMCLGGYSVVRELGRGGMGTVYLAQRTDDREAGDFAVKVINGDLCSDTALHRFSQESRILATLEHPNITRFLDSGTTADGRPFLVMQYEAGDAIDLHCDHHNLTVEERLTLFLDVCSAIHYAHQSLVIHRDLKPSNVLVTEDGTVKVLDFGTAKLLDPSLLMPGMTATATGLILMTPGYASPEQVRGEPVTTMSDVYGLGALLYEVLTGHRAHRFASGHPAEVVRVVCEVEPLRPSSVVNTPARPAVADGSLRSPKLLASCRGTHPARLQRLLAGDLDKILLKTLRKEPRDRYGSVKQLAQDLRRHMAGLPVQANHGSLLYHARMFVQRRRTLVVACVVAISSVLVFTGGLLLQDRTTERQRAVAEVEREKAEQVSAFLGDLLDDPEQLGKDDEPSAAREMLERGVEALRRRPNRRPEIRASLMEIVGRGYLKLGLYEEAEPLLRDSLALRTEHLGEDHPDTASSLHELGRLTMRRGHYKEAENFFLRALEIRQRASGKDRLALANEPGAPTELGMRASSRRAEALARRSLEPHRKHHSEQGPRTSLALHKLGARLFSLNRSRGALPFLEEALDNLVRGFGDDDSRVADSAFARGKTLRKSNRFERGEAVALRLIASGLTLHGLNDFKGAALLGDLASVYESGGRLLEASGLLEGCLEIRREILVSSRWLVLAATERLEALTLPGRH